MEKPIVNYVWMQFEEGEIRPLPSHLFYNVQKNAKRYRAKKFIVWVQDHAAIGPYRIPKNVDIRRLDGIQGFPEIPIMELKGTEYGWAKVDIARLLVVRHILENERRHAIYSDMDVEDVRANACSLRSRLRKYGVAVGATFKLRAYRRKTESPYENGYVAFTEQAKDLLERTINACVQISDYGRRSSVYDQQFYIMDQWAIERGIPNWHESIGSFPVLPPCHYKNTAPRAELR